jgi:REP element-mobilizing transposase RayT
MDIEIRPHSKIKTSLNRLHSKAEDLMYNIILKIPERFIPAPIMEWLNRYTTKRINQLKQETIRQTWRKLYLQQALDEISQRQTKKEESS